MKKEEPNFRRVTVFLDDPNDASIPLCVDFETLFIHSIERCDTLIECGVVSIPLTPLAVIAMAETILKELVMTKKMVVVVSVEEFDAFEMYGNCRASLQAIRRLLQLHLSGIPTVSWEFVSLRFDEIFDYLKTVAPYAVMIIDSARIKNSCAYSRLLPTRSSHSVDTVVESIRVFRLAIAVHGFNVIDPADVKPTVGFVKASYCSVKAMGFASPEPFPFSVEKKVNVPLRPGWDNVNI